MVGMLLWVSALVLFLSLGWGIKVKKGVVLCNLILYPFVDGLQFLSLSLPLRMRVCVYIYINVNTPPYLRCTNDLLYYRTLSSPEVTYVTHVSTSTERKDENQSCSSAIDDISIQIEKAKAKASKLSSVTHGSTSNEGKDEHQSGSSAIDDISFQIERARAKSPTLSPELMGDFGPQSISSYMSGSTFASATIEKEFVGFKPISESLPPLPLKAYELILRLHRLVGLNIV